MNESQVINNKLTETGKIKKDDLGLENKKNQ